jgi:sugar lactone lactonase YvrE
VVATGVVTRIAGTYGTYSYADGTGSAALFSSPFGLTADGAGNLFVSDSYNNVVRKVVTSTGIGVVTTLAGLPLNTGSTNGNGDGARFANPDGVATDNAGNAYVADVNNGAIRQIALATGITTTLASAAAMFSSPRGITFDGAGNLFIGDTFNATLRKIVIAAGVVSTFAGKTGMPGHIDLPGPSARFGNIYSTAIDSSGNLCVADPYDMTIRKVVISTGAVSTVAGSSRVYDFVDATGAAARFQSPVGIATDGGDNLYVTDGSTVRSIVASTGVVQTIAGVNGIRGSVDAAGTSARFANNTGIVFDGAGSLYVADSDNHTIRKVVISTGMVSTVVGVPNRFGVKLGPLPGVLNRPRGLALAGPSRLLITDEAENVVLSAQF